MLYIYINTDMCPGFDVYKWFPHYNPDTAQRLNISKIIFSFSDFHFSHQRRFFFLLQFSQLSLISSLIWTTLFFWVAHIPNLILVVNPTIQTAMSANCSSILKVIVAYLILFNQWLGFYFYRLAKFLLIKLSFAMWSWSSGIVLPKLYFTVIMNFLDILCLFGFRHESLIKMPLVFFLQELSL